VELNDSELGLLKCLGESETSQYGECYGMTLDALVAKGLADIMGEGTETQNAFIAKGRGIMYRAVRLTDAGREALMKPSILSLDSAAIEVLSCLEVMIPAPAPATEKTKRDPQRAINEYFINLKARGTLVRHEQWGIDVPGANVSMESQSFAARRCFSNGRRLRRGRPGRATRRTPRGQLSLGATSNRTCISRRKAVFRTR
jgi:hypothetical protein